MTQPRKHRRGLHRESQIRFIDDEQRARPGCGPVCDNVWCYKGASRVVGIADEDQPWLRLLEELGDPLWHNAKILLGLGGILMQAGPHQDGGTCVLAKG